MWTEISLPDYERTGRRYASDATEEEWSHIAPLLPPAKPGGRPRTTNLRDVFDAILYMASTGCQWRMLPNDFPPVSTVRRYFYDWRDNGVLRTINHYLVIAAREAMGREAGHPQKPLFFVAMLSDWVFSTRFWPRILVIRADFPDFRQTHAAAARRSWKIRRSKLYARLAKMSFASARARPMVRMNNP